LALLLYPSSFNFLIATVPIGKKINSMVSLTA
jgi:hypothetical protein